MWVKIWRHLFVQSVIALSCCQSSHRSKSLLMYRTRMKDGNTHLTCDVIFSVLVLLAPGICFAQRSLCSNCDLCFVFYCCIDSAWFPSSDSEPNRHCLFAVWTISWFAPQNSGSEVMICRYNVNSAQCQWNGFQWRGSLDSRSGFDSSSIFSTYPW